MLKKITSVLMLGVTLMFAGCGEQDDVITEDMFIGKWKCRLVMKVASRYDENGVLGAAEAQPIRDEEPAFEIHFLRKNNTIMYVLPQYKSEPLIFESKVRGGFLPTFDQKEKIKMAYEYKLLSKNKFKIISDITTLSKDSKLGFEIHQEELCLRISSK